MAIFGNFWNIFGYFLFQHLVTQPPPPNSIAKKSPSFLDQSVFRGKGEVE